MTNTKAQRSQIVAGAAKHLLEHGPPYPGYKEIGESADISRQLIRYYFSEPDELMCEVCDLLAEAYRMALVNGVETLDGPKRLQFIFDFYFDLVDDVPKPRDDQTYDAMFAFSARSDRIATNLRGQYTLLGQVLQLELKMQFPDLSLEDCAEIGYLFVCIMYGHWKLVGTLGVAEDHKLIARRAIDRIITSYATQTHQPIAPVKVWETKE